MLRPTVSRPVCFGVKPHLGPKARFLLLSDSCGFADVERPFWCGGWSAVNKCCWASPAQSRVRVPWDSWPYFAVSDSRHPQSGRPGTHIYIPQEQDGPVTPRDTGFPFRRLLRLAGLRWGGIRTRLDMGSWLKIFLFSRYVANGADRTENTASKNFSVVEFSSPRKHTNLHFDYKSDNVV
jgi:hypothetical protein